MPEISAIKNFCSQKSGPKLTIIAEDLQPLKPVIRPNLIEIGETTLEKCYKNFLYPSIFWLFRGPPWPKVTGLGGRVHQPHPLATCKILSRSDNPSPRYFCCKTRVEPAGCRKNCWHCILCWTYARYPALWSRPITAYSVQIKLETYKHPYRQAYTHRQQDLDQNFAGHLQYGVTKQQKVNHRPTITNPMLETL